MKISKLVAELKEIEKEHGDLQVLMRDGPIGSSPVIAVAARTDGPDEPSYVLLETI